MIKRLFSLTIAILAMEAIAIAAVASSAHQPSAAATTARVYNNPAARHGLAANAPTTLLVDAGEDSKPRVLDGVTLQGWWQGHGLTQTPNPHSSPANLFFYRTGTAHPWSAYNSDSAVLGFSLNSEKINRFLLAVADEENLAAVDAQLTIENGRARVFVPDRPGRELDIETSYRLINDILLSENLSSPSVQLPFKITAQKLRLGQINSLGIREHLGSGGSDFSGSSNSRIQNIRVGAEQFRGLIIPPGEEFSFNKNLGPIEAARGYRPELVIKPEGTVPELGGGLCQVSTTAFRAAFFSGLPITQRRNHAYAVKYYDWISDDLPAAPGLDATIYPGAVDLKFTNDTDAAILIWTRVEGSRLYFDFYGKPDDRQVAVDGPHPFDRKPSGAVKSTVTRKVISGGETTEATFKSNYVSPDRYPRVTEYPKPIETGPQQPTPPPSEPLIENPT